VMCGTECYLFLKKFQCQLFLKRELDFFHSHKRFIADQYESSERPKIEFHFEELSMRYRDSKLKAERTPRKLASATQPRFPRTVISPS
jgi:hypothetical protein